MSYSGYGVMLGAPQRRWPASGDLAQPDDFEDYTYFAVAETAGGTWPAVAGTDPLVAVALSITPSGAGETVPSRLTVANGYAVTVWLAGGVAGRFYTVRLLLTTAAGRTKEVLIQFPIDPTLARNPIPDPPVPDFGTAITWTATPSVTRGILGADGAQLIGADGASLQYAA